MIRFNPLANAPQQKTFGFFFTLVFMLVLSTSGCASSTGFIPATPAPSPTPTPPPVTEYDDQYTGSAVTIVYSGIGWQHAKNKVGFGYYDNSISNTTEGGDTVTIKFTGTAIQFIGTNYFHLGILDFSIDGGLPAQETEYAATTATQVSIYSSPSLMRGVHTLTMLCRGMRDPVNLAGASNPAGNDTCEFDAVTITG